MRHNLNRRVVPSPPLVLNAPRLSKLLASCSFLRRGRQVRSGAGGFTTDAAVERLEQRRLLAVAGYDETDDAVTEVDHLVTDSSGWEGASSSGGYDDEFAAGSSPDGWGSEDWGTYGDAFHTWQGDGEASGSGSEDGFNPHGFYGGGFYGGDFYDSGSGFGYGDESGFGGDRGGGTSGGSAAWSATGPATVGGGSAGLGSNVSGAPFGDWNGWDPRTSSWPTYLVRDPAAWSEAGGDRWNFHLREDGAENPTYGSAALGYEYEPGRWAFDPPAHHDLDGGTAAVEHYRPDGEVPADDAPAPATAADARLLEAAGAAFRQLGTDLAAADTAWADRSAAAAREFLDAAASAANPMRRDPARGRCGVLLLSQCRGAVLVLCPSRGPVTVRRGPRRGGGRRLRHGRRGPGDGGAGLAWAAQDPPGADAAAGAPAAPSNFGAWGFLQGVREGRFEAGPANPAHDHRS